MVDVAVIVARWPYTTRWARPRLAAHWRTLNGGATIMTLLLAGARFRDGVLIEHTARREEVPMAA